MDALFCSLTTDMSDEEIKECIYKMHPRCVKAKVGFLLTVNGYDHDRRELWEIPEVITFFQRLIDIGFLSVLAINAQMVMPGSPGFGAMEVWMVATGKITKMAKYPITEEHYRTVFKLIEDSNVKCEAILAGPCPNTGIKEHEEIIGKNTLQEIGRVIKSEKKPFAPDGPQRHGARWWNDKK